MLRHQTTTNVLAATVFQDRELAALLAYLHGERSVNGLAMARACRLVSPSEEMCGLRC